jgi:hypothetical protein
MENILEAPKTIESTRVPYAAVKLGKGWSAKQLRHCLRAAEPLFEDQIVSALRRQLSWTHIKTIVCEKGETSM